MATKRVTAAPTAPSARTRSAGAPGGSQTERDEEEQSRGSAASDSDEHKGGDVDSNAEEPEEEEGAPEETPYSKKARKESSKQQEPQLSALMEMMKTMQLELARVAMQQQTNTAPPAETRERGSAQQQESLSLQVGQQQQQSPPPTATSPGAARRATVDPPKKLKYAEASVARTLEDWLYEVELYCEQLELPSSAQWIRQARFVMDRDLWEWWEQYQQQATAKGAPITDWKGFAEALREQFVATGARREAIDELARIQQKSGEDINTYLLRVAQLHGRTRRDMQEQTVMRFALSRTNRVEWPFTYARTIAQVEAGAITTLAGLRAFMQQEALSEPGKQRSASSSSGAQQNTSMSGKSNSSGSRAPGGSNSAWRNSNGARKMAAALQHETDDGEARSEGESEETRINATSRGGQARSGCFNCRGDHHITECTKPKMCWGCNSTGHVRADCPTAPSGKTPAKPAAAGNGAPVKKKTSFAPSSKNE